MSSPVRRNDPCPCGSGLRYKECHGKLGAASTEPALDTLVQRALQRHQQGQVDEAERAYRRILERSPGNAIATHYLGMIAWHRGDPAEAERMMRASLAADASVPDFHNNLGLLLRDTRSFDEAIACFRRALGVDSRWIEAYSNLGLTLEAAGRWEEACAAYREAIAREPRFAVARQNLGRLLLAMGRYAEGWEQHRWRLAAQRVVSTLPDAAARRLPASLAGRSITLLSEQGIGDVLFFLRFAPELVRRGARLAFRGDSRLHPLLQRTGLFELGLAAANVPVPAPEAIFVGELPWLLEADDPAAFPGPLQLEPASEQVARVRELLPAGRESVGLTWRAGTLAPGPTRTQHKEAPLELLSGMLRARKAVWVSVQRHPRAGEREALEAALGAPVLDASEANGDLEQVLAWMSVLDDYVGVSNFNTHLRAGLALPMQVLVPFPAEWRWGIAGERSPWFPTARVTRQRPDGRWE